MEGSKKGCWVGGTGNCWLGGQGGGAQGHGCGSGEEGI